MLTAAIIHFYWALGGKYGLASAGPSIEGKNNFIPSKWLIFVVAVLLFCIAALAILLAQPSVSFFVNLHYIGYFVSVVFIVRAIGDFKYVGFFKKAYNSNFAYLDTKYFSPLILFLGIAYGLLSTYGA